MHLDNFAVIYDDVNLLESSTGDFQTFGNQLATNRALIFRNQNLKPLEITDVLSKFGKVKERPPQNDFFQNPENPNLYMVGNSYDGFDNSDETVNETKYLFSSGELGWHSNGILRPFNPSEIAVLLYCVKTGEDPVNGDSILSIADTTQAYEDLPDDMKELFADIVWQPGYVPEKHFWYDVVRRQQNVINNIYKRYPKTETKPLILKHPVTGKSSVYFNPYETVDMYRKSGEPLDAEWLNDYLFEFLFQEKYIYHHHYKVGDFLLMDQFGTLHKRNHVTGERLLYRAVFDYSKINL